MEQPKAERDPERTGACDELARKPLITVEGDVVSCRLDLLYGILVWALLLTGSVGYLVALKWHHHAKHRAQVADSIETLETLALEQATAASRKIRKVPVLSTLYVFGAHYVYPYIYVGFAFVRPYIYGFCSYVLPILRRLSPGWIFMQWGMHVREIRLHRAAVARLGTFGADVAARASSVGRRFRLPFPGRR